MAAKVGTGCKQRCGRHSEQCPMESQTHPRHSPDSQEHLQGEGLWRGNNADGVLHKLVKFHIRDKIGSLIPIAWKQLGHTSLEMCFWGVYQTRQVLLQLFSASPACSSCFRSSQLCVDSNGLHTAATWHCLPSWLHCKLFTFLVLPYWHKVVGPPPPRCPCMSNNLEVQES